MKFLELDNLGMKIHEVYITIDNSKSYAEIIELFRSSENGPGFVLVTSVKMIDPQSEKKNIKDNFKRFEP